MRVVFVGRDRIVWKLLLLHVVTLGISRRVWLHRVVREVDGHEALGIDHRLNAALLASPAVGLAFALALMASGVGVRNALTVGALFLIPSTLATLLATRNVAHMLSGSPIRYRSPTALWAATLVPLAGHLFHIAWTQGRLNRFWLEERRHPERGIEVDVDLAADPAFVIEMKAALRESIHAGSRFERRRKARRERWGERAARWGTMRAQRRAVREAGGSTPLLPWRRPAAPAPLLLNVTCGRCDTGFELRQDPTAETPLVCPQCGATEVLPALWDNPLRPVPGAVPAVRATCPACKTRFHAARRLDAPTTIACPRCGRSEVLQPPRRPGVSAGRRTPASPSR